MLYVLGFPDSSNGKESTCNAGDPGSIPGSERSPVEGHGNPLHYSCLENPMDRGSWWATVHGVTKNQTWPSYWAHTHSHLRKNFSFLKNSSICAPVKVLVAQSCPTPCNPIDCSPPGSSVHGILQARILEWVVIPFSRGSFQSRDWTWVSPIAGGFFTIWTTSILMSTLLLGTRKHGWRSL